MVLGFDVDGVCEDVVEISVVLVGETTVEG